MAKLGPNWRDLESDFQAARLIDQVADTLPPGHAATPSLRAARSKLHPAVNDPEATEEFEARLNGIFEEPAPAGNTPRQDASPQPSLKDVLALMQQMQAQLDQLKPQGQQ